MTPKETTELAIGQRVQVKGVKVGGEHPVGMVMELLPPLSVKLFMFDREDGVGSRIMILPYTDVEPAEPIYWPAVPGETWLQPEIKPLTHRQKLARMSPEERKEHVRVRRNKQSKKYWDFRKIVREHYNLTDRAFRALPIEERQHMTQEVRWDLERRHKWERL
jgi:hypothetical protein